MDPNSQEVALAQELQAAVVLVGWTWLMMQNFLWKEYKNITAWKSKKIIATTESVQYTKKTVWTLTNQWSLYIKSDGLVGIFKSWSI